MHRTFVYFDDGAWRVLTEAYRHLVLTASLFRAVPLFRFRITSRLNAAKLAGVEELTTASSELDDTGRAVVDRMETNENIG